MRKLIVDGKVAVLYSPGFGAGWSTWAGDDAEAAVFSPELAQAVLDGKTASELKELAAQLFPNAYVGGVAELTVTWVPVGEKFVIREYDGSEHVELLSRIPAYTA